MLQCPRSTSRLHDEWTIGQTLAVVTLEVVIEVKSHSISLRRLPTSVLSTKQ
jgi:hypothetical protein